MKVLVCGSRDWPSAERVFSAMQALPRGTEIIHGAARGPDQMAGVFARALGFKESVFPAAWTAHGKRAGIVRNLKMLDEQPDLVLAFWDGESKGTKRTIDEARKRGIPVEVISS